MICLDVSTCPCGNPHCGEEGIPERCRYHEHRHLDKVGSSTEYQKGGDGMECERDALGLVKSGVVFEPSGLTTPSGLSLAQKRALLDEMARLRADFGLLADAIKVVRSYVEPDGRADTALERMIVWCRTRADDKPLADSKK